MFYREKPGLADKPFTEQLNTLLADGFSFGDSWQHYLQADGGYDVMEVVLNAEPAQRQWAREHGVKLSKENWNEDVLVAQLEYFKPDIWFCHAWLSPEERLRIRRSCPSLRYVIGYDGALKHDPDALAGCDAILSCVRESASFYTSFGMRGYWLPWGFDPRVAARLQSVTSQTGAVFCGSIGLGGVPHYERVKLLDRLRSEPALHIYVNELTGLKIERQLLSFVLHRNFSFAYELLKLYPFLRRLRYVNTGVCYGLKMFQLLSESKVSLNLHGDAVKTAANIRLFEATGVGTCLLTDWKDDLRATFDPDREVVAFRCHEECLEKLRYLLQHESMRQTIAAAGQKRCLKDHNIGRHILTFADEVLKKL